MDKIYDNKWDVVLEYLPLAEKMANIYQNTLISYDDMYQEACLAIYDSIADYKPDRDTSLLTFLTNRIRYRYYDLLAINKFEVYVPPAYCRAAFRLHRLQQKAQISTGSYLSNQEAGEKLNLSETTVEVLGSLNRRMLRHMTSSLSDFCEVFYDDMDETMDENNETIKRVYEEYEELMRSDLDIEEDFIMQDFLEYAIKQIEYLPEKQRQTVLYRLGFITGKKEKFKNIAKIMGGVHQNAQKQYHSGIKNLRKLILNG